MKMQKFKNIILFSLIFLSQIHTLLRGCDIDLVWLSNGLTKSLKLSSFLFVKHFTDFILLLLLINPKGIKKGILYLLVSVSFFDVLWFVLFSGVGGELIKLSLSALLCIFLISKYNKWVKY